MKDSTATISNSTIYSQIGSGLLPTDAYSIGVDLLSVFGDVSDNTRATIDNTTIVVSETPTGNDLNNGHGVRLMQGQADIRNGSRIFAENAGILLAAYPGVLKPIAVRVDDSLVGPDATPPSGCDRPAMQPIRYYRGQWCSAQRWRRQLAECPELRRKRNESRCLLHRG